MHPRQVAQKEPDGNFQGAKRAIVQGRQAEVMRHVAAQVQIPGLRAFLVGETFLKRHHPVQGHDVEIMHQRETDIVAAHKKRERHVFHMLDRKGEIPPAAIEIIRGRGG